MSEITQEELEAAIAKLDNELHRLCLERNDLQGRIKVLQDERLKAQGVLLRWMQAKVDAAKGRHK